MMKSSLPAAQVAGTTTNSSTVLPLGSNTSTAQVSSEPVVVEQPRLLHRLVGVLKRNPKKSIAFTYLAVASAYYWSQRNEDDEDDEYYYKHYYMRNNKQHLGTNNNKKNHGGKEDDGINNNNLYKNPKNPKVLVLPFYRMKLVEKLDPKVVIRQKLESLFRNDEDNDDESAPIEMEVDKLVTLIHEAAEDPSIVGLYARFGHGFGFETGGWAHVEEVRNALKVFRESHRVHREPNLNHDPVIVTRNGNCTPKPLYAYADTFVNPASGSKGMMEYYLATAFTHIQLQEQGALNLFGFHATNSFFKDALHKYGVKVHVFKHGAYKNVANMFTKNQYTKEHRINVQNIVQGFNQHMSHSIYHGRPHLQNFEFSNFWNMVQNRAGTFHADMAHKVGFVDYLPRLDPLDQLLESNKSDKAKEEMKQKWGKETDMDLFTAKKSILITDYATRVDKRTKKRQKKWDLYQQLKTRAESSPGVQSALSALGYQAPFFNLSKAEYSEQKAQGLQEKIAVLKIGGAITDATARKAEVALRKIKKRKDVKAVVLRVDSPGGAVTACETIYQEIQDLPQKVIVSFGNVSASGGYYISAGADRIFASPTTITGSIGVFMVKMDFRGLAEQYGIHFDSVKTSDLSGSFDPFYPMNDRMKENLASSTERTYWRFKTLVGTGRRLDMDFVESVAQGRVWTGDQAKQLGLVDELGGLDRAIAYAQRTCTTSGNAQVLMWPPKKSMLDRLMEKRGRGGKGRDDDLPLPSMFVQMIGTLFAEKPGIGSLFQSNEMAVLDGLVVKAPSLSGMMLTTDENSAIRCLLENNDMPDISQYYPTSFFD